MDKTHDYLVDAMRYCVEDLQAAKRFEAYCLGKWPVPEYKRNRLIELKLGIKKVIFNKPATIILWTNGTKTVVKCSENDAFDPEKGLAMAICKEILGDQFKPIFKKWLPEEDKNKSVLEEAAESLKDALGKIFE